MAIGKNAVMEALSAALAQIASTGKEEALAFVKLLSEQAVTLGLNPGGESAEDLKDLAAQTAAKAGEMGIDAEHTAVQAFVTTALHILVAL